MFNCKEKGHLVFGTFPPRYLSEKKLKQGDFNRNQNKKYLV